MSEIALTEVNNPPSGRTLSNSSSLQKSLERIHELPAMPAIAKKMLALPLNTDEGEAQLLKLIAQDPQISARIIGLSNASLFGAPGMISSISDAAMRLGLTQIKAVAIGMATIAAFSKVAEGKFKAADLWTHSLAIASAMRVIARYMPARLRPMEDQIFLAGLLHDIGYNVLSFIAKDLSNVLYDKLNTPSEASLLEIERELLGTHHGEIGAQLGAHWGLPAEIIAVIRYHHTPDHPDAADVQPLVKLAYIAEKLLPDFAIMEHAVHEVTGQEWHQLGIDPGKTGKILEEIGAVAAQAKQLANAA
ncbi:HDOD domain-containing protein [Nitrosomonas sp. sh817]|uniref:HDOD domain-containing protein n=1 Tax=Nitrosomonas sp. sh817 TaxID=3070658 RepID=UPI0027DC9F86|nr:HDOD domain-containing protein [Nitrosomonas sp. sh817]WMJ07847.1 HDOD domain-containing protein [Nitrosomonas sp. sh817]